MSEPTLTEVSRTEAQVLQSFIGQVDYWKNQHGDKAATIEITYYPDDDGFEVSNNEANNGVLKRNRTTVFRADLLAWASNQLRQLQGYDNSQTVTEFSLSYKNDRYGVRAALASEATDKADDGADDKAEQTQ
ncbi:hypothetical protein D6D69_01160 [Moraxella catarrhalis]|uniref:hypothetical protein n=1 Tax=Moraxella catarrhalis TaxID=480 RepID=UPI0007E433FD|nr:hypothetical protein [Moraxella catarrhalis]OAV05919.1 hypothetical protein AO380_1296 [Moraxella catarrhalis]OAV09587.1 hypothetical protein AO378_1266 [Moraxella catarrhalis]OAV23646.1 hypothetical protein AO371_1137 [Moraxella catarrhalis]OAV31763.1 hypothetical protein AO367_0283 [Moraxella catarrhalis]RKM24048.1 hypothetical protein D6D69_01160 [Moraxella catarrhalis]